MPPPASEEAPADKDDKWGPLKKKAGWCVEEKTKEILEKGKAEYDKAVCTIRELGYLHDQVVAYRKVIFELVRGKRNAEHTQASGVLYNTKALDQYIPAMHDNVNEFWTLFHASNGPERVDQISELQRLSFGTFPKGDGKFYRDKLYSWAHDVNQNWKAVKDLLKPPPAAVEKREKEARERMQKAPRIAQPSFN